MSDQLKDALKFRYATKRFDATKKIDSKIWDSLKDSLVLSASSYGLQPWKFIVVTSDSLKNQLKPASWNQSQVSDCSHYIVLCARKVMDETYVNHYIEQIVKVRGTPPGALEEYRKMMLSSIHGPLKGQIFDWTSRQVYIALGSLLTAAALLRVDACPMEGFARPDYDRILGLSDSAYGAVVCCALGYRHTEDGMARLAKVRFEESEVLEFR